MIATGGQAPLIAKASRHIENYRRISDPRGAAHRVGAPSNGKETFLGCPSVRQQGKNKSILSSRETMSELNYFNYFTEIEEYFWQNAARTCWFRPSTGPSWKPGRRRAFPCPRCSKESTRPLRVSAFAARCRRPPVQEPDLLRGRRAGSARRKRNRGRHWARHPEVTSRKRKHSRGKLCEHTLTGMCSACSPHPRRFLRRSRNLQPELRKPANAWPNCCRFWMPRGLGP